ncbi:MAG TPA: SGNH/GDSL hydrolase family protein [bacterium]
MRSRARDVLLLLAALALALLAADRGAAWFMSRPPKKFPDSRFSHERFLANSLGNRDFEYPVEKPPRTFRVIAIGDSFTYGRGASFDDVWSKRLERYLYDYGNVKGQRYEVLNWGHPGVSTPFEVETLKKDARRYGADVIVLGYCLNDAEEEVGKRSDFLSRLRQRTVHLDFEKGQGLNAWLYDHWALYRFVRQRIFNTERNRGHLAYYRELYRDDYVGWGDTRAAIAELGTFRRESGIPVVVMIFPLLSWDLDDRYPFRGIHARLHRELKQAGLPFLDLLTAYRGLDHEVLEAVPYQDPHPSDVAHRIAAEEMYVFLTKRGLLPRGEPIAATQVDRRLPPPWR